MTMTLQVDDLEATELRSSELAVSPSLVATWHRLPDLVRSYLGSFLTSELEVRPDAIEPRAEDSPSPFLEDLAAGGPRLRAAFPALARTVVGIRIRTSISVRITCAGIHLGPFFELVLPTDRMVRFDALHRVTVRGGRLSHDAVSIDVRGIIRQLGRITPAPRPDY